MNYNRRKFIRTSSAIAAGSLVLPQWACGTSGESTTASSEAAETAMAAAGPSLDEFGIQLYTLRDDIPKDPQGILKQLASFGYKQIEGYEGEQGMFWGMGHTGFKKYIDELGLNMVASHCNIDENFEEKAAQAAEIGMKYLICPYIGAQENLDAWKGIVDKFNTCGETCKKNGIRFAYHNHAYSFEEIEGVIPQDYMMDNVDADLVDFELDIYWVVTGGADPIAYFKKYPNRFTLCHVKDRLKDAPADESHASCILGTGSIDYPSILKVAAENGMKYYIVEQERYDEASPIESAEKDAEYLKELVFV